MMVCRPLNFVFGPNSKYRPKHSDIPNKNAAVNNVLMLEALVSSSINAPKKYVRMEVTVALVR